MARDPRLIDLQDPDWNWVQARAACSAVLMFERLRSGALANVAARNAIHDPGQPADRFQIQEPQTGRRFTIVDAWGMDRRAVAFALDQDRVTVQIALAAEPRTLQATLTLNDDGQCKFRVGDDELDPWQLLKRALEQLLFQEPDA